MKKVLVGMSGGVDSSVAALLLKKDGYEVIGATMVLFGDESDSNAVKDARKVCEELGIKHYVFDFKSAFKKDVQDYFIKTYTDGKTPNPCVVCNRYIKFGVLWEKAQELGCDFIATGHYAKRKDDKLLLSEEKNKDQSYFLCNINKDVIKHIIFPLESFHTKDEIRTIAKESNLSVAGKKDSEEICFIKDNDYVKYLKDNDVSFVPGKFIDKNNKVLGTHKGICNYTIGQRKGLGLSSTNPLYVTGINKFNNTVTLGDLKDLYKDNLVIKNINLLVDDLPKRVGVKIRFRSKMALATLEKLNDNDVKIIFDEPQRAITKGQFAAIYDGDVLQGGGVIE